MGAYDHITNALNPCPACGRQPAMDNGPNIIGIRCCIIHIEIVKQHEATPAEEAQMREGPWPDAIESRFTALAVSRWQQATE